MINKLLFTPSFKAIRFEELNYLGNFDDVNVERNHSTYRQWPSESDLEQLCSLGQPQLKAIKTKTDGGVNLAGIQLFFEGGIESTFLQTDWSNRNQSETKTVKLTGKKISKIIEQGDNNSARKLQFVHENGTDTVYHKNVNSERSRVIPKGHVVVGVYGHF